MQVDRSTVVLLGGLGTLRFGASVEEVIAYLGEPASKCWEPGKHRFGHGFLFANAGVGAVFAEANGRLVLYALESGQKWMRCRKNDDLQFRGIRLLGGGISEVCKHLAVHGVKPVDGYDIDDFYVALFTYGISVDHDGAVVHAICWSAHPGLRTPGVENSRWKTGCDFGWSLANSLG